MAQKDVKLVIANKLYERVRPRPPVPVPRPPFGTCAPPPAEPGPLTLTPAPAVFRRSSHRARR